MGCRAPQAPSTRTRLGVPACGRSAWVAQEVRMPAAPSSPCPRPRPASGVRCPVRATSVHACLSTGPLSSVRCGRLSVQVSAVWRPVWASGVCALPRALCPAEVRSWSAAWAAVWLGWPGSAWSPAASMTGSSSARGWSLALEAGAGAAGPAEASVWTWPSSSGGGWAVASSTAWPTRIGRVHARIVRWWEPVCSEARLLRQADRHAAGESLGGSWRVEPNIKKPIGHIPLAKQH